MANWSASENGDTCVDLAYARKDSDVNSIEEDDLKIETDRMQFKGSTKKECLVANLVGVKYGVEDGTEDADDVNDAGDTSSSFSLEECMNEFRARRIRRTSLTHHRQEADKEISCGNNVQGTTELDLINQNLCNKEHERKCKPCRNGFCYCFTSDSGDGGGNFGDCHKIGSLHNRNFRRNRRSECIQILNSEKRSSNSPRSKEVSKQHIPQESVGKATSLKKTKKTAHRLKAISSLETSTVDGPLIQIVQELHENCVVSKVKINKHKMQKFKDKTCAIAKTAHTIHKKAYFNDAANARKHNVSEKYTPTAPILDNIDVETNVSKTVKNIKNDQDCSGRRHNSGGQLLQKRLSISKMRYNPKDIKKPPPKPPRSSLCNEYKYCESATSISSSVRDAERVVDDFLAKKGVIVNAGTTTNNGVNLIKISKKPKNEKKFESIISKSDPLSHQKEPKEEDKNVISTYPSLSGLERAIDLKNVTLYDTNVRHAMDDATKVMRAGWNESKITSMLNYDAYKNQGKFVSMSSEAQPQQDPSTFIVENEKTIGWQMPPKITLDAVDGIVHHNLASNFEDKNTPVKKKISPSQNSKNGSGTQKFIWSEQLRNLSPWSNKYNINDTNNSKHKLPSSSKGFVISSKKKLLRLISPKKGNKDRNCLQKSNTPYRNVGVQTIYNNVSRKQANGHSQCELCSSPQSPPGSYHSPMQSSNIQYPFLTNSQNTIANETEPALFDFSRTVHSPPKKSNRKLNFPLNCTFMCKKGSSKNIDICNSSEGCNHMKTYRSFNSEVNQDASILKINHILSNIRAKLEANDDEAARKFLETVSIVDHDSSNFDWSDSHHKKRIGEHLELHNHSQPSKTTENYFNDPIYSEIEDDSFLVSQSPEFGNRTAIQHLIAAHNPDIVYAKVNKGDKPDRDRIEEQNAQLPLAKIMKDSLKNKKVITKFIPLPTLSEPPGNESTSYSMPLSSSLLLSHCQSLNNVRVLEHNLLPKKQRNLSKSDLSLHLSNIFLENLCKSELLVNAGFEEKNYEKLENDKKNVPEPETSLSSKNSTLQSSEDVFCMSAESYQDITNNDSVSYELANDEADMGNSRNAGSSKGSNTIVPPFFNNQSTPKKRSFVTKEKTIAEVFSPDGEAEEIDDQLFNSCPDTPCGQSIICIIDQQAPSRSLSMTEVSEYEFIKTPNLKIRNALKRYNSLKNVVRNSFRKSKSFIKKKGKRLSTSLNISMSNATASSDKQSCTDSIINLEDLLTVNESATVSEQLAQTVSICRQFPDLEISMEMVEAERLLLFSALRRENQLTFSSTATKNHMPHMRFFIDDMFLPVVSDGNQDIFFNYFYIVTFECGGIIKSTKSSECMNGIAVFRDNGIEFVQCTELETDGINEMKKNAVKCNIFMLRLRKISTVSIEPNQKTIIEALTKTPSPTLKSTSSSSTSSSSLNEIVSRFRLHASFTLDAKDFMPYEYVQQESVNSDRICLRASCLCTLPLTTQRKSTNLSGQLRLKGRAEMRFPKHAFNGFLNVKDPQKQHYWNRRWCTLDGIFLHVWQDQNSLCTSPLLVIDLRDSKNNMDCPLTCSSRELCARPHSFSLECKIDIPCENTSTVFFGADTQENVDDWLKNLNTVLDFITTWLC